MDLNELQNCKAELIKAGIRSEIVSGEPGEEFWQYWTIRAEESLICTDSQLVIGRLCIEWDKLGPHETKIYPVIGVERTDKPALTGCSYIVEEMEDLDSEYFDRIYRRVHRLPWTIIETNRCIIRETTEADLVRLYEIYEEPSVTDYMDGLYLSRQQEAAYLREYQDRIYAFYGFGVWSIVEKESGLVIGRAGISMRQEYEEPELGFVIDCAFQHQGYAGEVCRAILTFCQEEYHMPVIQAFVRLGNSASVKLLRSLGFVHLEDVQLNGILHERYLLGNLTNLK